MNFIAWVSTCFCFHSKLWGIVRFMFWDCDVLRGAIGLRFKSWLRWKSANAWFECSALRAECFGIANSSWALCQPRVAGHPQALYQLWVLILFPCNQHSSILNFVWTRIWVVLFEQRFRTTFWVSSEQHLIAINTHTHRPVVLKELTLAFAFVKVRAPILWGRPATVCISFSHFSIYI